MQMCASAFRAFLRHFFCNYNFTALIAVISRDSVSPPELTGNTPVTDIFKPVQISLAKAWRNKFQFARFQRIHSCLCHLVHTYKPLRFDHRFYSCTTTVMCTDAVIMWNYFHKKTQCIQICNHGFTCLITVHTCVFTAERIDSSIIIHDVDFFKIVAFAYFEVIRVMCRCDLNAARSEFFIYIFVSDHRDLTVSKRQFQHLADQIFISLIFRVYCNCSISEKCLRTGSCDLYETSFFSCDRIIDVPEKSILILMLNFCVRNRSLAYRTPVDDSGAFVDISFFV